MTKDQIFWAMVTQVIMPLFVYIAMGYLVVVTIVYATLKLINRRHEGSLSDFDRNHQF